MDDETGRRWLLATLDNGSAAESDDDDAAAEGAAAGAAGAGAPRRVKNLYMSVKSMVANTQTNAWTTSFPKPGTSC